MAGNSRRRGAVRSSPKKGPTGGSGGQRRKGLESKGPTPKAVDREHHPAHRAARSSGSRGDGPRPRRAADRRPTTEMVAGRNSVVEALRAQVPATTLYLASGSHTDDRVREALRHAADRGIPIMETGRADLDRLTGGAVHQGVALQVPPYEYAELADLLEAPTAGPRLLVALDGVTDPRNLGAIVRSVAAFGGQGVLVPERRSVPMTAAAWKASAGAATRIPVARVTNLTRALQQCQQAGLLTLGLDGAAPTGLPDLEAVRDPVVVVVGSEGRGLSRLVRETCDVVAGIPLAGAVESLNAGVALGVALYEIARLRALDG